MVLVSISLYRNGTSKPSYGLPWRLSSYKSICQRRRRRFGSWVRKVPWRRKWQPTAVFLPGKPSGQSRPQPTGLMKAGHSWATGHICRQTDTTNLPSFLPIPSRDPTSASWNLRWDSAWVQRPENQEFQGQKTDLSAEAITEEGLHSIQAFNALDGVHTCCGGRSTFLSPSVKC